MILVTGASGLLGANFVLEARKRSKEVIATYNKNPIRIPDVKCLQLDLTDEKLLKDVIFNYQPEYVVHCAALTNVDWCEEHPLEAKQVHEIVSKKLACAVNEIGSSLVYISTDAVFDGIKGNYSEIDIPNPVNTYAQTKLNGENAIKENLDNFLIIRTNIYGWNFQNKLSLAEWILLNLEQNQLFPAFQDVIFSPIFVNDLSNVILDLIEMKMTGLYNVGSSKSCNKYEFAKYIAQVFLRDEELIQPTSIDRIKFRALRPKNTSLQTNKINMVLKRDMPDVIGGLKKFKEFRDSGYCRIIKKYKTG